MLLSLVSPMDDGLRLFPRLRELTIAPFSDELLGLLLQLKVSRGFVFDNVYRSGANCQEVFPLEIVRIVGSSAKTWQILKPMGVLFTFCELEHFLVHVFLH